MCDYIDFFWRDMQENDAITDPSISKALVVDGGNELVDGVLKFFPSAKNAVVWGYLYRNKEGWILDRRQALRYMMDDASQQIISVTKDYDKTVQFLETQGD